jgi:succinate dehydrogenase/fumarate reductase iron-sulfur protein
MREESNVTTPPGGTLRSILIEVLRYRPEQEDKPVWESFTVPFTDDMSVLQGLQAIKDDQDGSLSFRWSCRMAICGSCGMMINGKPGLSCQTFLRDLLPGPVRIEALAHFPIERDLVVSVEGFVKKLESIKPYIIPKEARALSQGEYLQTPAQLEQFEQYSACINCMLCYAACPQFGLDPEFTGPGVLHFCTATTLIRATAAGNSAWRWSMPPRACGVAPPWAIAQRSARNMSTRRTPSTRTRSTARRTISCAFCHRVEASHEFIGSGPQALCAAHAGLVEA